MLVYNEMVGGQPFQDMMKKAAMTIHIHNQDLIIKEVEPEQKESNGNILHILPYILALMLQTICNHGNLPKQHDFIYYLYFD
jgi:hypothetical protein